MTDNKIYDTCIIGGGLAGLALSIGLAKSGYTVALFEKEQYPFHKVCGEYISLESLGFIESLGLPVSNMQLPVIKRLLVSAPNGNLLQQELPLGGFGISRYRLDYELNLLARQNGVHVFENCKAEDVVFVNEQFHVQTTLGRFSGRTCCGSFGKRSNLDLRMKRPFFNQKPNKLNNYIAVKYHINTNFPADTIALHNFKDGYCGISQIEEGKYCLCYLTNAKNLASSENSIPLMEKNILQRNPHLQQIFEHSEMLYDHPLTISQISFAPKTQVENHLLLLGDAAGMITPLCGNGMSMALHAAKIATPLIQQFLSSNMTRDSLERVYTKQWNLHFQKRIRTGRRLQKLFGKEWVTNLFIFIMKKFPPLTRKLIQQTHGEPF